MFFINNNEKKIRTIYDIKQFMCQFWKEVVVEMKQNRTLLINIILSM